MKTIFSIFQVVSSDKYQLNSGLKQVQVLNNQWLGIQNIPTVQVSVSPEGQKCSDYIKYYFALAIYFCMMIFV
jgi:hypothetical protein